MCDVFFCFCPYPYGVLVQVVYLIVPIPDICLVPYFVLTVWIKPIYKDNNAVQYFTLNL